MKQDCRNCIHGVPGDRATVFCKPNGMDMQATAAIGCVRFIEKMRYLMPAQPRNPLFFCDWQGRGD